MEGHLIDSDILRKALRPHRGGGRRVRGAWTSTSAARNDDPSFARARGHGAATRRPLDRILEPCVPRAPPPSVGDARFAPAEADGILPDEFYSTTNFDTLVRIDGQLGEAPTRRWTAALVTARRRAALREAGAREAGRAGGAARAGHPRAAARAQPRLLGVRLHVERHLGRGQQGHRDRGHRARDAQDARGGREDRGGGRARRSSTRAATRPWRAW